MGLFSILGKIAKAALPVVGTALGGPLGGAIGGGLAGALSGSSNKHSVGAANDATQLGLTNAENALDTQFGQTEANFNPFITGGQKAFGAEGDLAGLNGNGAQGSAISSLQASPLFQTLFNTGRDSILAAGSATGGLRGGNVNDALYKNGQQTLAQVIQNQLATLGGISGQGLSAAGTLGGLGAQDANANADLLTSAGKANAGAILGQQAVDNNTQSALGTQFGGTGVQDQITKFIQGLTGGGNSGGIFSGSGSGYGSTGGALPNFPTISVPGF